MKDAVTLLDVAKLTWPKVPGKGDKTFHEYCKFLYDQKDDIWVIIKDDVFMGMIAAKNTMGTLYVTMFVTLQPGAFEEFINHAVEYFGEITHLAYKRRGRDKVVNFQQFKKKALA